MELSRRSLLGKLASISVLAMSSKFSWAMGKTKQTVVEITSPSNGETIGGVYTVTITTNGGATRTAQLSIDGGIYFPIIQGNPGRYSWDTTKVINGRHTLMAKDTARGLAGYSLLIAVTVRNLVREPIEVAWA